MGGFGGIVRDFAPKAADAIEEHTPQMLRAIGEKIAPIAEHFKMSKAGTALLDTYQKEFRPLLDQNKSALYEAAASGSPALGKFGPITERAAIESHAAKITRATVYGGKDEDLAFYLNAAKKEKGDTYANVLSDHLHSMFHDAGYTEGANVGRSKLSSNLIKIQKTNKNSFVPKNTAPYSPPGKTETKIKKYANAVFAAKAALPHSASSLLTLLGDGAVPYVKALYSVLPGNYENSRFLLQATNAISELHSIEYNQHMDYINSGFKKQVDKFKWIPGSVGEILHSNRSMPGMSAVRKWNLTLAGMSAKFKTEEMAAKVMRQPQGGYAEKELMRLGLDPAEIRKQGGNLTPENYKTAIFRGVDRTAFIDDPSLRSAFSQESMMGRITNLYHGYITRSSRLIRSQIWEAISDKNPVKIASTFATLAIIAPEIGNNLGFLESIARGHSIKSSSDDWKKQEGDLWGSGGFMNMLSSRVEALTNIGAWGVVTGFTRGVGRKKLIESLAGPIPNAAANAVQDHADHKALARDFFEDIPTLGTGGWIAHHLYPTKKEIAEDKPKTARQIKSAQTRASHKRK